MTSIRILIALKEHRSFGKYLQRDWDLKSWPTQITSSITSVGPTHQPQGSSIPYIPPGGPVTGFPLTTENIGYFFHFEAEMPETDMSDGVFKLRTHESSVRLGSYAKPDEIWDNFTEEHVNLFLANGWIAIPDSEDD